MNPESYHPKRLEELQLLSAGDLLTQDERRELNQILRDHPAARSFAARALLEDSLLIESLAAREIRSLHEQPSPMVLLKPNTLARAAAWAGGFFLLGKQAQAANTGTTISAGTAATATSTTTITLLMKKFVTSTTFAILIMGAASTYAIHQHNQTTKERVVGMDTEIRSLSNQLGIKTSSRISRGTSSKNSEKSVNITKVLACLEDDKLTWEEHTQLKLFKEQLKSMDMEELKTLLLDAEKISNPVDGDFIDYVMERMIEVDPAEATRMAAALNGRSNGFIFRLAHSAADAFEAWLKKDPLAADAWYRETVAAGGLRSKNIPPNGLEDLTIDRSFERLRFKAMVEANPTVAESMIATMLPEDITNAMKELTDPNAIRTLLPKLNPEQRVAAAEGVIGAMAAKDPNAALSWAKSLEMDDSARNALMATGIEAAVNSGKLDLAGVSKWAKDLNIDPKRLSEMLVSAATSVSLIPRKNPGVIDVENSVHWNRVAANIDWLRQEAPTGSADRMVGQYLGKLANESMSFEQSTKAFEAEIARRGNADPSLTIEYASYSGLFGTPRHAEQAIKYLKALPPSRERDHAIEMVTLNGAYHD